MRKKHHKKKQSNFATKILVTVVSVFIFAFLLFSNQHSASAKSLLSKINVNKPNSFTSPEPLNLVSKNGSETLKQWFLAQTEGVVTEGQIGEWFGPWTVATSGNAIYLGLSNNLPAGDSVATVTQIDVDQPLGQKLPIQTVPLVDNSGIIPVFQNHTDDNGIHLIDWTDETNTRFMIPGTDPGFTDGWNGGNVYWFDTKIKTNGLVKMRCAIGPQEGDCIEDSEIFPNVVHFFGSTQVGDRYFLGASIPVGNTSKPQIWGSTDAGNNWQALYTFPNTTYFRSKNLFTLADPQAPGKYQLYTINMYNNPESALANDIFYSNERDSQLGVNWSLVDIEGFSAPHNNIVPVVINEETAYYVNHNGTRLVMLDNNNNDSYINFPEFTVGYKYHSGPTTFSNKIHPLTTDNQYLYVVADNGGIYKFDVNQKSQPYTWELLYQFEESPSERPYLIHYWEEKMGLIIGTIGPDANLYFMTVK